MEDKKSIKKDNECPFCKGKIVPIIYGDPTDETFQKAQNGELILGGCCIEMDEEGNILNPELECLNCHKQFR